MSLRLSMPAPGSGSEASRNTGVPILMYHRVSDRPTPGLEHYCVSPASFQAQMSWLKGRGYQSVSLDALADHHLRGASMPARPVIITFDDGYRDNLDYAYPVLDSLGLSAVIFLVAGAIGKLADWDAAFGPPAGLLAWPEIRAMSRGPITFGAHTVTHPHLCQLEPKEASEEIGRARTIIEDGLGLEVTSFAYPYSDFSCQLRDFVEEAGYKAACSSMWGISSSGDDVFALRRLIVGGEESLESFEHKMRRAPRKRAAVRSVLRAIRRSITRRKDAFTGGS